MPFPEPFSSGTQTVEPVNATGTGPLGDKGIISGKRSSLTNEGIIGGDGAAVFGRNQAAMAMAGGKSVALLPIMNGSRVGPSDVHGRARGRSRLDILPCGGEQRGEANCGGTAESDDGSGWREGREELVAERGRAELMASWSGPVRAISVQSGAPFGENAGLQNLSK